MKRKPTCPRRSGAKKRHKRMAITKAWKRRQRAQQMAEVLESIERSGLLSTGKETAFFKMLGIGEEKNSGFRSKAQWWAPAYLVRLNRFMKNFGVSSKLRTRTIRCYMENKAPPTSVEGVLARYTEEQLLRGTSNALSTGADSE